jgi:hypothetical protein
MCSLAQLGWTDNLSCVSIGNEYCLFWLGIGDFLLCWDAVCFVEYAYQLWYNLVACPICSILA